MKRTADLSTALRSGPTARRGRRDDKFVAGLDSALPGKVRGTADPSASLGMTKERATAPWKVVAGPKAFFVNWGGPQTHHYSGRSVA
jgi:hypothetical protein